MKEEFPIDTKVYSYKSNWVAIGWDMFSCSWCEPVKNFEGFNASVDELYVFLKENGYEYFGFTTKDFFSIDKIENNRFATNRSFERMDKLFADSKFIPVKQNQGGVVFKVV
jgi:hypothetical protein